MSIYRTTNPLEFDDVDGIIVNETAPAPNIQGVAANTAILVGQFERGPVEELTLVGSIGQFKEYFGDNDSFSGNLELKNKKFGILKIIRAEASDAVTATKTLTGTGPADAITFEAKYSGAYGNEIEVTVEDGSDSGKKYTITDTDSNAVLPAEVYDNITVIGKTQTELSEYFSASNLINPVAISPAPSVEPDNQADTALATGSDGTIADTDYESAIAVAEQELAGNVMWCDYYTATIRGYLKTHVLNAPDKMVILCSDDTTDTLSSVISDADTYRDTEGRIIYAWNPLKTTINGVETDTQPGSWLASIISNTSPHIDPAYSQNAQYTLGASTTKFKPTRAEFIQAKDAGLCVFEVDPDIGIKPRSGIVTQIVNSSKVTILRRRMADYLTQSIAYFLKNYQNAPNTQPNRSEVKASIIGWIKVQVDNGILPSDEEVETGLASLVDSESLNTDTTIGLGFFKILYKQRIYSSMRFIVLQAEIGETVVVTEGS